MREELAILHRRALPNTWSSRRGAWFVGFLYSVVESIGFVKYSKRDGKIVGIISGIKKLILTLVVDPKWQRQGIGKELISRLGGSRYVYTNEQGSGFYEKMNFRRLIKIGKVIFLWKK